jgi:hypothetical protein
MNTLEDRVRAATTETAQEIAPGSIPPLSLHDRGRSGRRTRAGLAIGVGRGARWPRVLIPVAAAASVIAVVAAALAIATLAPTRPAHPGGHLPRGAVTLGEAPAYDGGAIPPYYVALEPGPLSGPSTRAVVRASATGAEVAVITPPAPYHVFTAVSAAADDRTFVLAAQRSNPFNSPTSDNPGLQKYFVLRLDPAGHTARLTALPIPGEPASQVVDEALSPDGSELAIALGAGGQQPEEEIKIISVRTGSERTWTGSSRSGNIGEVVQGANPLSWTADGRTLAFDVITGSSHAGVRHEIRLLDTTAPGSSLWSSRVAMRFGSDTADAMITPDGSKIVAPVVTRTTREFAEYSVASGKQVAVLGIRHYRHASYGGWPLLFWADSAGGTLIVYDDRPNGPQLTKTGEPDAGVLAVVTGARFTQLPGTDEQGAW